MRQRYYDNRVKFLIKKLATYSELGVAPKARKAIRLVLDKTPSSEGFDRRDGIDYFANPVAIAQMAIDFGLVKFATGHILSKDDIALNEESDVLLTSCLLHNVIEYVDWVDKEYIVKEYGQYVYDVIDNVTKRDNEPIGIYLDRVISLRLSSLVKILDQLNNVGTLDKSTLSHRKKQLNETREHYIPLIKQMRYIYFEDSSFYWQSRTIMTSILNEIERSIDLEDEVIHLIAKYNNTKRKPTTFLLIIE